MDGGRWCTPAARKNEAEKMLLKLAFAFDGVFHPAHDWSRFSLSFLALSPSPSWEIAIPKGKLEALCGGIQDGAKLFACDFHVATQPWAFQLLKLFRKLFNIPKSFPRASWVSFSAPTSLVAFMLNPSGSITQLIYINSLLKSSKSRDKARP